MDDTLYDEYTYVRSGFRAVANFLSEVLLVPANELYHWMWKRLQTNGRGAIFDDLLQEHGAYTSTLAKKCVSIYRMHEPDIQLPKETEDCLKVLKNFPLYLVTDGNKIAQYQKVQALGLYDVMEHCYITHRYGLKNSKPSPYCFLHIQKREEVPAEDIVYIADNPHKDFVGIKPLGFRTIRIMTGEYRHIEMSDEYEAELRIGSLKELPSALKQLWTDIDVEGVS